MVDVVVEERSGLSEPQRSFLPARRVQRAVPVPQLSSPRSALKSLQRSSDVSILSLFSSLVSALDAWVTLKATGISYFASAHNL